MLLDTTLVASQKADVYGADEIVGVISAFEELNSSTSAQSR